MLFAARLIVGNPFSSEWIFVINRLGCGFALLVSAILVALLRQQYRTNLAPLGTDTVMRIE